MGNVLRRGAARIGLILFGLAVGLAGVEASLRLLRPTGMFGTAAELSWMRRDGVRSAFVVDPEFGFRPVFGVEYSETGTLLNDYGVVKPAGVGRVLYLGDSVTRRGRIIRALMRVYDQRKLEHWNAGVETFNTVQEVEYYERYNRTIRPDHVILTGVMEWKTCRWMCC